MNLSEKIKCYSCKKDLELEAGDKVGRTEECPYCYASLHCCRMCTFHDSTAYNECREPNAPRIVEKEKANFCDYYILKGIKDSGASKDELLSGANALFKD